MGHHYCHDSPLECKNQFPNVQFENIWRKDLLELAEGGFAKRFQNVKFKSTKFGNRFKVGIIGSGPAGEVLFDTRQIYKGLFFLSVASSNTVNTGQ